MQRNLRSGLPKRCTWVTDRHGKQRVRFFGRGGFSIYITGTPWSEDFMRQYAAALDGAKPQEIGVERAISNSLSALVAVYLDCSPKSTSPFKTFKPETQRTRRNILENFREQHGDKLLFRTGRDGQRTMLLTAEHMQVIVNSKAATPFAQRNFLNTVRALFKWAKSEGRVPANPTLGVERQKLKSRGYPTWSEGEIERFEATHAIGTKARLAFALALYTGQRRSDIVRIGPQHIQPDPEWKHGVLVLDQKKTEGADEAHIEIPVHPKLREIVDATLMVGVKTFLVTHFGKAYTAPGFGNWFRELCDAAGCPDVSARPAQGDRPPARRDRLYGPSDRGDSRSCFVERSRALYQSRRAQAHGT
jgi:hypothetical protein